MRVLLENVWHLLMMYCFTMTISLVLLQARWYGSASDVLLNVSILYPQKYTHEFAGLCFLLHWKLKVVMVPTLLLTVASAVLTRCNITWYCITLHWRHNGYDSVSNHQCLYCLLNRFYGRRSKKTSKLRVTGLCEGNSPGTGEFPAQMASNAENFSIWWRHYEAL